MSIETKGQIAASNKQKVVIITTRFNNPDGSVMLDEKISCLTQKYPIADVKSINNPNLQPGNNLGNFFFHEIITKQFPDLDSESFLGVPEIEINDFIEPSFKFDRKLKVLPIGDLIKFKQNFLKHYITEFNNKQKKQFKTEYITHIHELLYNGIKTRIFIYHHWLDKQNLEDKRNEFLTCLKKDVKSIIEKEDKNIEIEFNWLIHDTDILGENYNGLLWFDSFEQTGKKKSYHPLQDEAAVLRQIPYDLQNDNIWCFVHQEEIDSYYKYIIEKIQRNKETYKNANELYNELVFNKTLCKERIELLADVGIKDGNYLYKHLAYLLDFPLKIGEERINQSNLEKKVIFLNSLFKGLITYDSKNYKLNHNLLK